ncbi:MAG: hypothetical protein WC708_17555 [Lentisphaeria bacterium]
MNGPAVHWGMLAAVLAVTAGLAAAERGLPADEPVRLFYRLFLAMYLLFSGIGCAYLAHGAAYFGYYTLYGAVFSLLFVGTARFLAGHRAFFRPPGGLLLLSRAGVWRGAMAAYLLVQLVALCYPENRLLNLLHPPRLDINNVWHRGLVPEVTVGEKLLQYPLLLLLPVYYYGVGSLRRGGWWLKALLIALPPYLTFCRVGYLGRSEILLSLAVLAIPFWLQHPAWRRWLLAAGLVALPFLLVAAQLFQVARLVDTPTSLQEEEEAFFLAAHCGYAAPAPPPPSPAGVWGMIYDQTRFPEYFEVVRRHGPRGRPAEVGRWLAGLPLPSVLVHKSPLSLNCELATAATGIRPGDRWFFICLTGLVTEAWFLLGPWWMPLHAGLLAVFTALLVFVYGGRRRLEPVWAFVAFVGAYYLNRAGIAGSLPILINDLLLMNLAVAVTVCWAAARRRHG